MKRSRWYIGFELAEWAIIKISLHGYLRNITSNGVLRECHMYLPVYICVLYVSVHVYTSRCVY